MKTVTKEKEQVKAETPDVNEWDEQESYWSDIRTIIHAYCGINGVGEFTQWGILIDAYDRDHRHELSGEMISKNISLKDATKNLWAGDSLYCLARELFIKNEGNFDERKGRF